MIDRRQLLISGGTAGLAGVCAGPLAAMLRSPFDRMVVSVQDFGAQSGAADSTQAIQAAIQAVESKGGGTVLIPGRYRCGTIAIRRGNVRLQGQQGWLVDARLAIYPQASNVEVDDLGIVDTRGDNRTYLADISGSNCRFRNFQLVKHPPAGGYQMYLRQTARGCTFTGLKLRGSNGIMVAGSNHLFDGFDLESTMARTFGGDDAFALKAIEGISENITIRNGSVRGYAAMVSLGSEIGTRGGHHGAGVLRNVLVENVTGDRCTSVAFLKPGALDYDYRHGLVEGVTLRNLVLSDPTGEYFRSGLFIAAGRGAVIRGVDARGIKIVARAKDQGIAPTAAVLMALIDKVAPAAIEDVRIQLVFTDPYSGAPHGASTPGFPVAHVVEIEKLNPASGRMSGIVLDVEGRGAAVGGIHVGPGLDGAISVERAVLARVATNPRSSRGAGIWSDSRLNLGAVSVDSVKLPKYGGKAFARAAQ